MALRYTHKLFSVDDVPEGSVYVINPALKEHFGNSISTEEP
jgi:hypothetical protein